MTDLPDHDPDLSDHDRPIPVITIRRSTRSRWAETRRRSIWEPIQPRQRDESVRGPEPSAPPATWGVNKGSWNLSRTASAARAKVTVPRAAPVQDRYFLAFPASLLPVPRLCACREREAGPDTRADGRPPNSSAPRVAAD